MNLDVRDEFVDFLNSTGKGGGGVLHMLKDRGGDTQFKYAQLPITRFFALWLKGIGCSSLVSKI